MRPGGRKGSEQILPAVEVALRVDVAVLAAAHHEGRAGSGGMAKRTSMNMTGSVLLVLIHRMRISRMPQGTHAPVGGFRPTAGAGRHNAGQQKRLQLS